MGKPFADIEQKLPVVEPRANLKDPLRDVDEFRSGIKVRKESLMV